MQPDFAVGKDTTCTTQNPFPTLKMSIQPFIYGHSGSFFTRKKNEIGM